MKKTTIWCFIISFILIVIGISLIVVSMVLGGFTQAKNILTQGLYASDGVISTYSHRINYVDDEGEQLEINESYEISSNEIKDMEIEMNAGSLTIEEHIGDTIQIEIKGEEKVIVTEKNGKIEIEQKSSLIDKNCSILVSIPAGKNFDEVILDVAGGSMNIESMYAKQLDIEIGVSDVKIEEVQSEQMSIEVGMGQLEIENGVVADAEVSVGIGSLIWNGTISNHLEADCDIGMMEIELSDKEEDYNYAVECSMGQIDIGDTWYAGVVSKHIDHMGAEKSLDLECGIGSIKIGFID